MGHGSLLLLVYLYLYLYTVIVKGLRHLQEEMVAEKVLCTSAHSGVIRLNLKG